MPDHRQRLRPAARALAALLAFGSLVGPLGVAAHAAIARHVPCAEHGDWIESPAEAGAPHRHLDLAAQVEPADAPDDALHGHDHCAVLVQGREGALAAIGPAASAPSATGTAQPADALAAVQGAIDLLQLAPKASPPRR